MPTRSGRTFSVGETSVPMDHNIQDTLNTLIDKIEKIDQQLQEVREQVVSIVRIQQPDLTG